MTYQAIARSVYSRKSIAIFDDVLSALDVSTQEVVTERIFGPNGLLRRMNITVVLATSSSTSPEIDRYEQF